MFNVKIVRINVQGDNLLNVILGFGDAEEKRLTTADVFEAIKCATRLMKTYRCGYHPDSLLFAYCD